jgi:hypothetical protein
MFAGELVRSTLLAAPAAALVGMSLAACLMAVRAEEASTGPIPTRVADPQDLAADEPASAGPSSPVTATAESEPSSAAEGPAAATTGDETPTGSVLRGRPAPGYSPSRSGFVAPLQRMREAAAQKPLFTVIEMPREPQAIGGPSRPRHALSFESESTRKAMRSIGLEATSCALQFRAPTKLSSDGGSVEVKAQARLSCRY